MYQSQEHADIVEIIIKGTRPHLPLYFLMP